MTERLRQPSTAIPRQPSCRGASETRPRLGFRPKRPLQAAGMRIEPAPSPAEAIGTMPGGDRRARAAARAARRALRVPRVAGDAVGGRLGEAADRQLRQQRQADDDRARLAQPPHHLGVGLGRDLEGVGAVRVDLAGDVDFVLDRDRHPEQRPVVPGAPPRLGLLGFQHRFVGEDLPERVQLRIEPVDPFQRLPDQLGRTDLPGAHHLRLPSKPHERDLISPLPHGPRSYSPSCSLWPCGVQKEQRKRRACG